MVICFIGAIHVFPKTNEIFFAITASGFFSPKESHWREIVLGVVAEDVEFYVLYLSNELNPGYRHLS